MSKVIYLREQKSYLKSTKYFKKHIELKQQKPSETAIKNTYYKLKQQQYKIIIFNYKFIEKQK